MIRVLQVVVELHRGGIETMTMNHLRRINPAEFCFDFVVHGDNIGEYEPEVTGRGGRLFRVTRPRSPVEFAKWGWEVRRVLTQARPDIVHCHLEQESKIVMLAAKASGVRGRIAHSHNTASSRHGLRLATSRLIDLSVPWRASRYLAASTEAGLWAFGPELVASPKFSTFHNAVDLTEFRPDYGQRSALREQVGADSETLVVGHIGRCMHQKNHEFLVMAFAELAMRRPNSQLWLVGTGDLVDQVKAQVEDLDLAERVRFWGVRADVPQLLAGMDVFVLPSWHEGLPVVGVEAQATGLRCLFSDRVTPEALITPSATSLPLGLGPAGWAAAMDGPVGSRDDNFALMREKGWDLNINAERLRSIYLEVVQ